MIFQVHRKIWHPYCCRGKDGRQGCNSHKAAAEFDFSANGVAEIS